MVATRADAQAILEHLASPDAVLRDDQWTAIEALVVHRRRALVVQRTGWGKSAVYFISAKLLRAAGHGPTVIVSPLLALMRNQVAAADRAGVHAATINSSNVADWAEIHDRVRRGELDVLLVSPERLNNPDFRDEVLPALADDAGLVVVDEAHCVSDWGHDFRPDYRRIRTLIADLGADVPVLATTATANDRVVADVAAQLGVGGGTDTLVLRGGLDRESLRLSVVKAGSPAQRASWLVAHLDSLPGSGIVYTLTVAQANDVAALLAEQGHKVASYTGATEAAEREQLEADLLANRVKALIATSALGMGFDKPDLGFVVHLGAPSSPIAYYQQVGRAGRSTPSAEVVLLPGHEDQDVWRYFASVAFPSEAMVRNVIQALDAQRPQSKAALEPLVDLNRSRLEMVLKVLDVDGAVRRVKGGWIATGQPWGYDEERYRTLDEARKREQQAMLDYQSTTACRMAFLRRQLDDPELGDDERCGRCDNCSGTRYSADVDAAVAEESRHRLMRHARATQTVADGAGQARPRPQREDHRRAAAGTRHRPAHRPRMGCSAARRAGCRRCGSVRRRRQGRGERSCVMGLGDAADGCHGGGLGQPPSVDHFAGPQARGAGSAHRPGGAAIRAGSAAGDGCELGIPGRGARPLVRRARCRRDRGGRWTRAARRRPG